MASTGDRIIVATNELFRRHGYNGTSLSQISEASGATIGSIYHFFPGGKEALGVAVIDSTGEIYRQLFEAIVAEAPDPATAYSEFFTAAAVVLEESDFIDPCPIGGIAREVANTNEPLRIAARNAFDSWIAAAQDHLTAVGISSKNAQELAYVFVSTVEGTFVLSRTLRNTKPLTAAGRHLTEMVRQAINEETSSRT
ncbi:MAG: TetR/AcrR family transcriptional regulator [Acidimicrobiales bacterium]